MRLRRRSGAVRTEHLDFPRTADANCRFADFVGGADANNGTTPSTPWKQAPGSTGYTGGTIVLGADMVLFFKAVRHRYQLADGVGTPDHTGEPGRNMVYALNGWGGRATISGDDDITGWAAVTSGEVSDNPNWASLEKIDLTAGSNGGAIRWYSHLYFGDVMGYPAQWPTPDNVWDFEDCTVDLTGGMRRAQVTTSTGVSPRINQPGGTGTTVNIVDPLAAAAFGASINPTGWPCNVWTLGNNVTRGTIASFDYAASTFTVKLAAEINISAGYCAYSFTHHPCLITGARQFATNTALTQAIAWRPNAGVTSVNRRDRGMANNMSYTTVEGGLWERFLGSSTGTAIIMSPTSSSGGDQLDPIVRNMQVRQCRADGGEGCAIQGNYTAPFAIVNPIFEGIAILEHNPRASGIRFGANLLGYLDGTPEQVGANLKGKITGNFFDENSLGRTAITLSRGNGLYIGDNIFRRLKTVHGNGIAVYGDADDAADDHHVITNNFFEEMIRAITVSVDPDRWTLPRSNYYRDNVCLGLDTGFVVALYSGDPDSFFERNIVMGAEGWDYSAGAFSMAVGNRVTIRNCVVAGMSWATLATCSYTVTNSLFTVNLIPPNDGPTRVSVGNTLASGAPIKAWDGVMTSAMEATLGPGPIGVFWTIPA